MAATTTRPEVGEVWQWLHEVPDPEIPVISVVDLGIVREVRWAPDETGAEGLVVTVTPTYSGCPATRVIAADIERAVRERGVERVRVETRLSPAWTSDWLSEGGRERLRGYGIAPPAERADGLVTLVRRRGAPPAPAICPRCGAADTERVSEFGSTPCKALHRCRACLEPFDEFKCI